MKRAVALATVLLGTQAMADTKPMPYFCPNVVSQKPAGWNVPVQNPKFAFKSFTYVSHADGQDEAFDLYLPPGVANPALLVLVHGGGFTSGTRAKFDNYVQPYVGQGFAVANLSYRLAGTYDSTNGGLNKGGVIKHDPAYNTFPAGLQDVRCAVRYLNANASALGFSSTGIGAYGVSAGGNLVAMLGATLDYDPTVYGMFGGAAQTLDSTDCPIGSPQAPKPKQAMLAPATVQLVVDESGNDTIGQSHNTPDNVAWGNVQYAGDVADMVHLFNTNFKVPKGDEPSCTAPNFPMPSGTHCVTVAGLTGDPAYKDYNYPSAYPDAQFAQNAGNSLYTPPVFFILNGARDPIVGPQNSADLFDTMTGADAAGSPVLVEPYMSGGPNPDGMTWSGTSVSANAAPITYFLMPGQGHIPALLDPGKSQHALNNDGSSPDLQAASCAVRNILFKVLELPNGGNNAASQP